MPILRNLTSVQLYSKTTGIQLKVVKNRFIHSEYLADMLSSLYADWSLISLIYTDGVDGVYARIRKMLQLSALVKYMPVILIYASKKNNGWSRRYRSDRFWYICRDYQYGPVGLRRWESSKTTEAPSIFQWHGAGPGAVPPLLTTLLFHWRSSLLMTMTHVTLAQLMYLLAASICKLSYFLMRDVTRDV